MTLTALIQRGFDSTIANWPLMLIRVAASVAITMVVLAAVIPIVMFAIYSGTMSGIENVEAPGDMIDWALSNALIIVALIIVLTLIIAVAIAIHSFVTGGLAGIYLDADRRAPFTGWSRSQLAVFTPDAWLRHGKRTWWPIFVIYNLTWGIWMLILLLPLLLVVPLLMSAGDQGEAGILACFIIAVWFGIAIVGSILVHVWTELSIIDCVREGGYLTPLRRGLSIFTSNLVKVIALVALMAAVTIGIAGLSIGAQFGFEVGMNVGDFAPLFIPVQIAFSLLQTVVSVFLGAWLMACFATIVNASVPAERGVPLATSPARV